MMKNHLIMSDVPDDTHLELFDFHPKHLRGLMLLGQ